MSGSEPSKEQGCKPVVFIGWPTIRKLAAGEDIETPAGILIAADGLRGCVVAPSPVVAEVVKRLRLLADGCGETPRPQMEELIRVEADRLERGE